MAARFGRDRWNEHAKVLAGFLNAIAVACVIGAFVAPLVNATRFDAATMSILFVAGLMLHLAAHFVLRYIASKE